jgi:hypothetical protein
MAAPQPSGRKRGRRQTDEEIHGSASVTTQEGGMPAHFRCGPAAFGHHLTSVLWHALKAVLVFLLFRRLGAGLWPGAFAVAPFAWHPPRVESVVWVAERKDVVSGSFFPLSLLAYARRVDCRMTGRFWWRAYLLAVACFVAGLMSKPMLVTLPFILLVLDFWPLAHGPRPPAGDFGCLRRCPFSPSPAPRRS